MTILFLCSPIIDEEDDLIEAFLSDDPNWGQDAPPSNTSWTSSTPAPATSSAGMPAASSEQGTAANPVDLDQVPMSPTKRSSLQRSGLGAVFLSQRAHQQRREREVNDAATSQLMSMHNVLIREFTKGKFFICLFFF